MLDVECDTCGRVLVGTRQIVSLTSTEAGIQVDFVCWCGRPGAEVVRRSAARRARARTRREAVAAGDAPA